MHIWKSKEKKGKKERKKGIERRESGPREKRQRAREFDKSHSSHLEWMGYSLFSCKQTCTLFFGFLLKQLENKFHFAYNINFIHTHARTRKNIMRFFFPFICPHAMARRLRLISNRHSTPNEWMKKSGCAGEKEKRNTTEWTNKQT